MKVYRLPSGTVYHFHKCRLVKAAQYGFDRATKYDIEYADSFWDGCNDCITDRSKYATKSYKKNKFDVMDDIVDFYEDHGRWPNTNDLKTHTGYVGPKTVWKRFDTIEEAVEEAKNSAI